MCSVGVLLSVFVKLFISLYLGKKLTNCRLLRKKTERQKHSYTVKFFLLEKEERIRIQSYFKIKQISSEAFFLIFFPGVGVIYSNLY